MSDARHLEISRVSKAFDTARGRELVVEGFDLRIAKGEFVSLIGHSGCGKSTVLSMVAGLATPSGGGILLDDREIVEPGPDRGVVFQAPCLLPWLTALENVRIGVDEVKPRATKKERRDIAAHHLELVGLGDALDKRPSELSQGMRQRVGLARAFALSPKCLLLDEPFGMLDSITRMELQDVLLTLYRRHRITTLMVTHDVDEAIYLSDRVVMMTSGPRARVGDIASVPFERPRTREGVLEDPRYYPLRERLLGFLESESHHGGMRDSASARDESSASSSAFSLPVAPTNLSTEAPMQSSSTSRVLSTLLFLAAIASPATSAAQPLATTPAPTVETPPVVALPPPQFAPPPPPPAPVAAPAPAPAAAPAAPPAPPAIVLGDLTIRPMLQARFRYEGRVNNYGNGREAPDQHFVTTRVRIGLDAKWRKLRILAQVQDVRNLGSFPGLDDGSKFGLHQGFAEVGNGRSYLRLGRQEIAYGDERMIGPLDWQMAARSFDALRVHHTTGKLELDAFAAMVRPQAIYSYTIPPAMPGGMSTTAQTKSRGDYLAAFQATYTVSPKLALDGYLLYRHDDPYVDATTSLPRQNRDIFSPGVRLWGSIVPTLGYTAEATFQGGRVNHQQYLAYAASADLRWQPTSTLKPLVGAGFALGSGQRVDGRVDGFNNFFPTNHKFYGFADLFNLQNLVDMHVTAQLRPTSIPFTARVDAYYFRQQVSGAAATWANAGGTVLGRNAGGGAKSLGTEFDLTLGYTPIPKLVVSGGYSVFVPLAAAERLGHDEVQHWFFVGLGVETP